MRQPLNGYKGDASHVMAKKKKGIDVMEAH